MMETQSGGYRGDQGNGGHRSDGPRNPSRRVGHDGAGDNRNGGWDPATGLPRAQGADPLDPLGRRRIATAAELAAVRRIGVRAIVWSVVFVVMLAVAVLSWNLWMTTRPATGRNVVRPSLDAYLLASRHPWLAAAYPWLAGATVAVLVVAVTYLVGWSRAAGVVRDAEAGDTVAVTYLKEGPRLGSIEWWWTTPPIRPKSEGRKVVRMGVVMLIAALTFIALAVLMAVLDWGRPPQRALGAAFPAAMALCAVPMIVLAVWCFVFTARPSAGKVKALGALRWVLPAVGLIGLGLVWLLSRDHGGFAALGGLGAIVVASYGMTMRMTWSLRVVAAAALDRYVTVPTPRRRIDAELRRMGESEQQQAFGEVNASAERVNRRRERRLALRATLYVIGFVAFVAVVSWVKVRTGMA